MPTLRLPDLGSRGDDAGKGDETPSVLWPGLEDGKLVEIDVLAFVDDLLAGGIFAGDNLGKEAADLSQFRKQL